MDGPDTMRLILASTSPRRRKLLSQAGSLSNVMGLPLELLQRLLSQLDHA